MCLWWVPHFVVRPSACISILFLSSDFLVARCLLTVAIFPTQDSSLASSHVQPFPYPGHFLVLQCSLSETLEFVCLFQNADVFWIYVLRFSVLLWFLLFVYWLSPENWVNIFQWTFRAVPNSVWTQLVRSSLLYRRCYFCVFFLSRQPWGSHVLSLSSIIALRSFCTSWSWESF